jgi:hypothetical protein
MDGKDGVVVGHGGDGFGVGEKFIVVRIHGRRLGSGSPSGCRCREGLNPTGSRAESIVECIVVGDGQWCWCVFIGRRVGASCLMGPCWTPLVDVLGFGGDVGEGSGGIDVSVRTEAVGEGEEGEEERHINAIVAFRNGVW